MISRRARDYRHYTRHFERGRYPVWKQPSIRIERHFVLERDAEAIEQLLERGVFGFGFSLGGIHTWLTLGRELKEVHYDSGPSRRYASDTPYKMFETTRFVDFDDYDVHFVALPPR